MNLKTVVEISMEKYEAANYNEICRAEILMHFHCDELEARPEKRQELITSGSVIVEGGPFEEADRDRFFLWYYINYVIDQVADD